MGWFCSHRETDIQFWEMRLSIKIPPPSCSSLHFRFSFSISLPLFCSIFVFLFGFLFFISHPLWSLPIPMSCSLNHVLTNVTVNPSTVEASLQEDTQISLSYYCGYFSLFPASIQHSHWDAAILIVMVDNEYLWFIDSHTQVVYGLTQL